jgi:hypothetical protein
MKKGIALLMVVLMGLLAFVMIAGCGSKTPAEAKAQLETDLKDLQVALQGMLSPTVYSSTDNFNAAWNQVKDAFDAVVTSAKEVKNVNTENLKGAFDDLKKAIGNVSSSESLTTKASDIADALTNLQKAWQETYASTIQSQ